MNEVRCLWHLTSAVGDKPLLVEHGRNEVGKHVGFHFPILTQLVQVVTELEAVGSVHIKRITRERLGHEKKRLDRSEGSRMKERVQSLGVGDEPSKTQHGFGVDLVNLRHVEGQCLVLNTKPFVTAGL